MLKKAGAVAAIAAGFMMIASPAFAGEPEDHHGAHWDNGGLVSAANGNNLNLVAGVCGNNVGVLGGAVPFNSPSIVDNCAAGGVIDGDDVNFWG